MKEERSSANEENVNDNFICKKFLQSSEKQRTKVPPPRVVPGFTVQSYYQKNVVTDSPPKVIVRKSSIGKTSFRMHYNRGDIPVCLEFRNRNKISWKVNIENIDYDHYLPIFFDGLRELEHPYKVLAREGLADMLECGRHRLLAILPDIVLPIKKAFNTRNTDIICCTLRILQVLVRSADMIGEALIPYYRQILPLLNIYKDVNLNIGDGIDYSQQKKLNVGDAVQETLQILERHGGPDAFINIKYIIPTYQSCIHMCIRKTQSRGYSLQ